MTLEEIRRKILAHEAITLDEERLYISAIRRGHSAALATRERTVRKAASKSPARGGGKGLDDNTLASVLDGL